MLKAGDMARIINAIRQENVGLIIECQKSLGFHAAGSKVTMDGENWVAPVTGNYWRIWSSEGLIETQFGWSKVAYIPEQWLKRIEPPELKDTVNTTKTEEV